MKCKYESEDGRHKGDVLCLSGVVDAMRSAGALIFVKCRKYDPHVRLLLSDETQSFFFAIVTGRHPCPRPRLRVLCNSRAAPSDFIETSSSTPGLSIYFLIKLQFRIDRTAGPTAKMLGDAAVNAITKGN